MRRLRFLPQAMKELHDQIRYYRGIRGDLGARFEHASSEAIRRAVEHPEHGAPRPKNTRRVLVKGFPFSVIYRASDDEVLIVAAADSRRKPDYWAARIS